MKGCVLAYTQECDYGPWPLQHHHVLSKQRIKRNWKRCAPAEADLDTVLADERNLVPTCERHHHRITQGWDRPLLASHLLDRKLELFEFAAEIGMVSGLERELRLYGIVPLFDVEPVSDA